MIRKKDITDVSQQCTHQHDLAVLAIARAARGPGRTVYDIEVPDRPDRTLFPSVENGILHRLSDFDGHTTATLHRDGVRVLTWSLEGPRITTPVHARFHRPRRSVARGREARRLSSSSRPFAHPIADGGIVAV